MTPMSGTVKRLVTDRGFGFIDVGDGQQYFFHRSDCDEASFDELREGQVVTFDGGPGPRGLRGEKIKRS
jgi:CspA family cold shock protein